MKRNKVTRILATLCAAVLMAGVLAGCAGIEQNSEEAKAQAENRQFMSDVNATMDELAQRLKSFNEAVSRGDVITMRTQADNAFKVLDNLESLEAPEVLQDVKQGYIDGSNQLKDALNAYIELYTAMQAGSFDYGTYADRLSSIQETYDQAVEKLKGTDEAATQL